MIEIQIVEKNEVGYDKPVYVFACPMCALVEIEDLSREYVRDETWRHVVAGHKVMHTKINLVFVNAETLEGMDKHV